LLEFASKLVDLFDDRRTNGRTDGRTDGQPENIVAASAGLAWQRHNENASFEIWIKMYKFLEFSELIFVVHG